MDLLPSLIISAAVFIVLLVIGVAAAFVWFYIRDRRAREAFEREMKSQYSRWLSAVKLADGELPPVDSPFPLAKDETAYYAAPCVLSEPRPIFKHSGYSFAVADGVNVGGAQTELTDALRPICHGQIVITDRRLLFAGDMKSRDIPLSSILKVKATLSRLAVYTPADGGATAHFDGLNGSISAAVIGGLIGNGGE